MSRQCCREMVASHDHPYQRSPLEPFPAERTSGHLRPARQLAASAQVNLRPLARVRRKLRGTGSRVRIRLVVLVSVG
jgi:hypothetical protein